MHPLRGALIALTALITTVSPLEAKADSHRVRGIDVSHHQGNIDWTAVSQDPQQIRFVIARASACRSTADTKYDANQSGASAAGLTTGAYHFACPDDDEGDARAEADFFVQRAALRSGDIVPALDLEGQSLTQSGDGLGCGTQALRDWVWTWLNRVRERTGLRAMIYTPPSFWRNCMGNDSSYADAGHDLLWIAHWCSPEGTNCPSVPADNWDGNGWTFWQYTSSGTVNGIAGNVDMNWHNGADIAPATIRTITVRASGGGSVEHELASCSTTCERFGQKGLTTQLIAVPDSNRVLQSWSGACSGANTTCDAVVESDVTVAATFTNPLPTARIPAPPALSGPIAISFSKSVQGVTTENVQLSGTAELSRACLSAAGASVSCAGSGIRSIRLGTARLMPGQRLTVTVNPAGAPTTITDTEGQAIAADTHLITRADRIHEEFEAASMAWRVQRDARARGGSYLVTNDVGSNITFAAQGKNAIATMIGGPEFGSARFYVDGRYIGQTNLQRARRAYGISVPIDLGDDARHRLKIVARGKIAIDSITAGGRTSRTPAPIGASWTRATLSSGSGALSTTPGSAYAFVFHGTGVTWRYEARPDGGTAQVLIDGVEVGIVDLFRRYPALRSRTFAGLSDGRNTLTIRVRSNRHVGSGGTAVTVDRLSVT